MRKATNIKWDLDGVEETVVLPTEILIPDDLSDKDEIYDFISETMGYEALGYKLVKCKSADRLPIQNIAYEKYRTYWMLQHGYTLTDLMEHLTKYQYEDPEDREQISTPVKELFDYWEESGFNGELWVCFGEFLGAEYQDIPYMQSILTTDEFDAYSKGIFEVGDESCECKMSGVYNPYSEIRNTHCFGPIFEPNGQTPTDDLLGGITIDAWKTADDDEEGEVLAKVLLVKTGGIVVDYHANAARSIEQVTEAIAEARKVLENAWNDHYSAHNPASNDEDTKFYVEYANTVTLTVENIDDIMCSALEGGITGWCCAADVIEERSVADWGHEQIARNGVLMLHDSENGEIYELTREKFLNGFKLWMDHGYDRYGAVAGGTVDPGNIDGPCADEIVQFAIFGELVYG